MWGRKLVLGFIVAVFSLLLLSLFLVPSVLSPQAASCKDNRPVIYLLYASSGSVSQLLNTNQIDSFIIWEPVVANAELSGIGKRIAVPSDLPPPGKWADAASCVFVLRNDIINDYPDVSGLLSALTTAAVNRTNEDPKSAIRITSDWVFGKNPVLTPGGLLEPLDVENRSFENMEFTSSAKPPLSGLVSSLIDPDGKGSYNPGDMMNPAVTVRGEQFLNGSAVPEISGDVPELNIGYLPSSDNFAPVYVMIRDFQYFCGRYGFCLLPDNAGSSRPVYCTLLAGNDSVARVNFIPGQSGGGIMTTVGQRALDGAYVGSIPAEMQIALGNPSVIIQSINTGGTGIVVDNEAPCDDWESFIGWVKLRSDEGCPVIIATVQSSIQEDTIREALAYENILVKLYGTNNEISYP